MTRNLSPARFPLAYSTLVALEVWDHSPTTDGSILGPAFDLILDVDMVAFALTMGDTEYAASLESQVFGAAIGLAYASGAQ